MPMDVDRKLVDALVKAHTEFIDLPSPRDAFEGFLDAMLTLTDSEYGFVGEVLLSEEKKPYLKTYALTNISWNEETRRLYEENVAQGLEFHNLDTLFGQVLVSGEPIIANNPSTDPRRGGLPKGHPPLNAFLGLPIILRGAMIGMAGLANKPDGYSMEDVEFLQPLLLTAGNFICTLRADLEKQQLDRALKASEIQARAVLESALDAVITIDDRGVVQSANPAAERIFGYQIADLIGQDVEILMPEPYRTKHKEAMGRYLETGETRVMGTGREAVALKKDGSRFPVELALSDSSVPGQLLFTGIVKDISERKRAEGQLEETVAQLAVSNENMLAILNETRLGMIMLDADGKTTFMSRSCEPWLRESPDRLMGKKWREVLPISGVQRQRIRSLFSIDPELRSRLSVELESEDGRVFWMEIEVRDDPRNPLGKILIFYDMTEVHALRARLNEADSSRIVGTSAPMQELFQLLGKVSRGDWTVLIEGETGVGKELVARSIHATSPRRDGPFIPVNCGGLTDSLLSSQLFGHRRGAFTGAHANQEGLFEAANGGTIFLDEVAEMPISIQSALLRVLQEREITRVGETKPRRIDVRILAATNRSLEQEAESGRFREDLFYRLRVARVSVPPLRERLEDLPSLVTSFLSAGQISSNTRVRGVEPKVISLLQQHDWPGNVRELKNVIESALITASAPVIRIPDLPMELRSRQVPAVMDTSAGGSPRSELEEALRRAGGNRSQAAKLLGISRATLYRRLAEVGIGGKFAQ